MLLRDAVGHKDLGLDFQQRLVTQLAGVFGEIRRALIGRLGA